jgi:metal-responsive CopG/Arc/MetJ family transcriptional regulator
VTVPPTLLARADEVIDLPPSMSRSELVSGLLSHKKQIIGAQ